MNAHRARFLRDLAAAYVAPAGDRAAAKTSASYGADMVRVRELDAVMRVLGLLRAEWRRLSARQRGEAMRRGVAWVGAVVARDSVERAARKARRSA